MTDETIVAIYDTHAHAELAAADLAQAGVPQGTISVHANAIGGMAAAPRGEGFWPSQFGGAPDHDTAVYHLAVDNGSTVVTVKASGAQAADIMAILESHAPVDIDERATSLGLTQTAPALPAADGVMQLAEESLAVGKRVVNRGGARIRRFVVETPLEQSVALRGEKIVLERHSVTDGRPAADSFSEKTLEAREMAEEAVISKTAHVYEEVGLRKEATDRVETVRDTVRKEEVAIEQIPGTTPVPRTPKV